MYRVVVEGDETAKFYRTYETIYVLLRDGVPYLASRKKKVLKKIEQEGDEIYEVELA